MQVTETSSADTTRFCRMDAAFFLLLSEHRDLVEELLSKHTREQLFDLARRLPYDERAAAGVWPAQRRVVSQRTMFNRRVGIEKAVYLPFGLTRTTDLAVYVAAASQFAMSKMLTTIKELQEQTQKMVQECTALMQLASYPGSKLHAAFKRHTE